MERNQSHYDLRKPPPKNRPPLSYHAATVSFQHALLRQALAQALGLQRTYFHRLLKSLGLS